MEYIRKWIIVPLIFSLVMSGSTSAWSLPLTFNIQGIFALPGGDITNGIGSLNFDTATGAFTGSLDFGSPPVLLGGVIPALILACIFVCKLAPVEKKPPLFDPPQTAQSLFEQAHGDIAATMTSSFGAAGSAIFTSHLMGDVAVISGDLTNIDFLLLPSVPSSFDARANAIAAGTGPRTAAGTRVC